MNHSMLLGTFFSFFFLFISPLADSIESEKALEYKRITTLAVIIASCSFVSAFSAAHFSSLFSNFSPFWRAWEAVVPPCLHFLVLHASVPSSSCSVLSSSPSVV